MNVDDFIGVFCAAYLGFALWEQVRPHRVEQKEDEWEERPVYLVKGEQGPTTFWTININTVIILAILIMVGVLLDFMAKLYDVVTTVEIDST